MLNFILFLQHYFQCFCWSGFNIFYPFCKLKFCVFVKAMFSGMKCLYSLIALEFLHLFYVCLVASLIMFQTFQHTGFWGWLYRSWDYPENYGTYSQHDRKSITRYFAFPNEYNSWIENRTKFWSHSVHLQNSAILETRVNQRGIPWK